MQRLLALFLFRLLLAGELGLALVRLRQLELELLDLILRGHLELLELLLECLDVFLLVCERLGGSLRFAVELMDSLQIGLDLCPLPLLLLGRAADLVGLLLSVLPQLVNLFILVEYLTNMVLPLHLAVVKRLYHGVELLLLLHHRIFGRLQAVLGVFERHLRLELLAEALDRLRAMVLANHLLLMHLLDESLFHSVQLTLQLGNIFLLARLELLHDLLLSVELTLEHVVLRGCLVD